MITPDWDILSSAFVKVWSVRIDVLQVILVGQFINCLKRYIGHCIIFYCIVVIKLTVFYNFSCKFQWFLILWVLLKVHLRRYEILLISSSSHKICRRFCFEHEGLQVLSNGWLWAYSLCWWARKILKTSLGFFRPTLA